MKNEPRATAVAPWLVHPSERFENAALLCRRGCLDDDSAKPGILRAAVVHPPHAHVDIVRIDPSAADKKRVVRALPSGVDSKILATPSVPCIEAAR